MATRANLKRSGTWFIFGVCRLSHPLPPNFRKAPVHILAFSCLSPSLGHANAYLLLRLFAPVRAAQGVVHLECWARVPFMSSCWSRRTHCDHSVGPSPHKFYVGILRVAGPTFRQYLCHASYPLCAMYVSRKLVATCPSPIGRSTSQTSLTFHTIWVSFGKTRARA